MVKLKEAKWRWAGHLVGRENNRWGGVIILLPPWDLHGQEMQKTENSGRIMKRSTSNNGRTQPGEVRYHNSADAKTLSNFSLSASHKL